MQGERKLRSYRLSVEALEMLDEMAADLGISMTALIEILVRKGYLIKNQLLEKQLHY